MGSEMCIRDSYWSTGDMGCPHDLAGLVCNDLDGKDCINPCKGSTSGASWKNWLLDDGDPHLGMNI